MQGHQGRNQGGFGGPDQRGHHPDIPLPARQVEAAHIDSGSYLGAAGYIGESRIFEFNGRHGQRFTLTEKWTLLLLDDQKVIHESTPIQPLAEGGHRDTLVLTFRSGGFLEKA